jgi:methionine-gamma-lyase
MPSDPERVHSETAVLTRGFDPRLSVGSARPAVFRSSTYVFESPEAAERAFAIVHGRERAAPHQHADLIYSRISHPNAQILEDQLVPLEPGAEDALVFNSGMAAIMTAFFTFARRHSSIVYTMPLYGGTTSLIHQFLEPFGVHGIPVRAGDTEAIGAAILAAEDPCIVFIETPANPTLIMTDIRAAAEAAKAHVSKPLVMVDNTFLGPVFQHPLKLGADLVLYSATKYLSGFSDLVAGAVLSHDLALIEKMRSRRTMFGNILQPDECWMLDGRLPTVALRMNRQSKNAQRIAEKLADHPAVARVIYPTLFTDAGAVAHLPGAVRLSGRLCSRSICAEVKKRHSRFCGRSGSRGMRFRWGEWKRWRVIRKRLRTPGTAPRNWIAQASRTVWCASRWGSKTGAICWGISRER